MLLNFVLWLQATGFFTYLRGSRFSYPVILSLHMVALALFGAMILITNMRLLGWTMGGLSIPDVVEQLRLPKKIGFTLAAGCGILLFSCKAEEYYLNVFFRTKLILFALLIVHSLIFSRRVYRNPSPTPGEARIAGLLSLLLWLGILVAGRGIGYIEPPFGIHA